MEYECEVCNNTYHESEIDIHHVMYTPEVTINACKKCHNEIHEDNDKHSEYDPDSKELPFEVDFSFLEQ